MLKHGVTEALFAAHGTCIKMFFYTKYVVTEIYIKMSVHHKNIALKNLICFRFQVSVFVVRSLHKK